MGRSVLIAIDLQNDFITESLGTQEAVQMLPSCIERLKTHEGPLFFTKDTHDDNYLATQEGKLLPVEHCIKGTTGWEFPDEIEKIRQERGGLVFEKPTFASSELAQHLVKLHEQDSLESIELIGLCTDICVISNALMIKGFLPEVPITVNPSYCAGTSEQAHQAALETMRSCQIL